MHFSTPCGAALAAASFVSAAPAHNLGDNPFAGKNYYTSSHWAGELNQTVATFLAKNDTPNAARVRIVQNTGTFVWITSVAGLSRISTVINEARIAQCHTRTKQIVELVLYSFPDRDFSAGASAGDFTLRDDGLEKYKQFVDLYAKYLKVLYSGVW